MDFAHWIAELSKERARLDEAIYVLEQLAEQRKLRTQIRVHSKEDSDCATEPMTPRAITLVTRRSSEPVTRRRRPRGS